MIDRHDNAKGKGTRTVREGQRALKTGVYYLGSHDDLKRLERFIERVEDRVDSEGWPIFDDIETRTVPGTVEVYGIKL